MKKTLKNYNLETKLELLQLPSKEFIKSDYEETEYKTILNNTINELTSALVDNPAHYCIAANQIGNPIQIGLVNVISPIILVNPKIEIPKSATLFPYLECHINLQNRLFITSRYNHIIVTADNIVEPLDLYYEGSLIQTENPELYTNTQLMEIIFLQQLIDSMNGILPIQRQFIPKRTPIINDSDKIQRNELCTLERDGKKINIKFKKINKFIEEGWSLIPYEELT